MKTQNKKSTVGKVVAMSAGVAALAAASYFFLGPNGKKNRTTTRGWMIKMKGEVVEKMEAVKDMTEDTYHSIVDAVAKTYVSASRKDEVLKLTKELKSHWKSISGKKVVKAKKKSSK